MFSIFPQPIMVLICLLLPAYFLYRNQDKKLITWIALCVTLDIFNSQVYLNLTALKLTGLVALPYAFLNLKNIFQNKGVKLLLLFFLLMLSLGIIYGYLIPWEDPTGLRKFKDLPQGRSILHLGSMFLEFLVAVVLSKKFFIKENRDHAIKVLYYGCLILGLSMLIEFILSQLNQHFDFYHFFTGGREYHVPKRMRGFAYEPRGAAQNCAYGILISIIYFRKSYLKLICSILFFTVVGFVLTFSMTGLITLCCGLAILFGTLIYLTHLGKAQIKIKYVVHGITTFIIFASTLGIYFYNNSGHDSKWQAWMTNFKKRSFILESNSLAGKLEVFDGAAVNFLSQNKKHLLIGTGPGLVALPATNYILEKDRRDFPVMFNALPHMGAILMLSNGGILAISIWLILFFTCLQRIILDLKQNDSSQLFLTYILFMLLYLLQIRYFYIFGLAFGLCLFFKDTCNKEKVCN